MELGAKEEHVAEEEELDEEKDLQVSNNPMTRSKTKKLNLTVSMLLEHIRSSFREDAYQTTLVLIQAT